MLELLGLLGGAAVRLVPMLAGLFQKAQDLKYEIKRMEVEERLEKLRGANAQQEIAANHSMKVDLGEFEALLAATREQGKITGDKWLDRINVSVRPILTYWWCVVLYTAAKVVLVVSAVQEKTPLKDFYPILMTDFDRAVVGSIIGFWFVDRALRKATGLK